MTNQIRPILLWMTSRSRSSMISSIFIQHGVYWGDTHVIDPVGGYDWYENQYIKQLQQEFKPRWGRPYLRPVAGEPGTFESFQEELAMIVPSDKTWMMKTGVEYFPAFEALNPFNVFIVRKPEDVAYSLCSKREDCSWPEDKAALLKTVNWRYNYMKRIQDLHGGVTVNTDNVINGDYSQVEEAITYCGIEYNKKAVLKGIIKQPSGSPSKSVSINIHI